jgi:8-oxo-dGTP diphosphatase
MSTPPRRRPPAKPHPPAAAQHPPDAGPDSEAAFLARYDPTAYDRVSVAVDVVVLAVARGELRTAVYLRREHPGRGKYALPGGFVRKDESLDAAAARILRAKAGLDGVFLEQLYTFGEPGRDPRLRVVSVAYYSLLEARRLDAVDPALGARVVALKVPWTGEAGGPAAIVDSAGRALPLAFDHADILGMAVRRIRGKLDYTPIGYELLPAEFTLRDLQEVHEVVRGERLNKDSFRRRMLAGGLIEPTGERERDAAHRPAELYRFARRAAP